MTRRRLWAGGFIWLTTMFLLAAMITIAGLLTFFSPVHRTHAFYGGVALLCAAEFVVFAWTVNLAIRRRLSRPVSRAVQVTVHVLIVLWLIATLVATFVITPPGGERGYHKDYIAVAYAALCFLFFLGAYLLYASDARLRPEERGGS